MDKQEFSIDDLTRILRESAGAIEEADLDGHILDIDFTDLGYDSVALMEASSRIERTYAISLGDDVVATVDTPRQLLQVINEQLHCGASRQGEKTW